MESKREEAQLEPFVHPIPRRGTLADGLPCTDAAGRRLVASLLRCEAVVRVSLGPVSLEAIRLACCALVSPWCKTSRLECVHGKYEISLCGHSHVTWMECVRLVGCGVNDAGCEVLCKALCDNQSLQWVEYVQPAMWRGWLSCTLA